jgi:argininosuccinate synthase
MIDATQAHVTGTVRVKLYKGGVSVVGRRSAHSLFDARVATFEDDAGAYDQKDATGFIRLLGLRLRTLSSRQGWPGQ